HSGPGQARAPEQTGHLLKIPEVSSPLPERGKPRLAILFQEVPRDAFLVVWREQEGQKRLRPRWRGCGLAGVTNALVHACPLQRPPKAMPNVLSSRLRFVWSLPSLIGHGPDTLVQGKSVQNDVPSENPGPAYKLAYTTSPRGIRENSGRFRPRSL